jgi:hypothetical protein
MIISVDKAGLRVSSWLRHHLAGMSGVRRIFLALLSIVNHYCKGPEEKKKGLFWRNLLAP